jgi:hypothetical protein
MVKYFSQPRLRKGMKSKKKAAKKGKSSKSKKDEWIHEGGVYINNSETKSFSKSTQERDEKFRRSRMKQENLKLQKQFVEKMKRKVVFNEVPRNNEEFNAEIDGIEESEESLQSVHRNSFTDVERLQRLLHSSTIEAGSNPKKRIESVNMEREHSECVNITSDLVFSSGKFENSSSTALTQSNPFFDWFFSSSIFNDKELLAEEHALLQARASPTYLTTFHDSKRFKVYGSFNNYMPDLLENLGNIANIPGIPNIWGKDIALNNLCKSMLKYILSYCDTVIEGRSLVSDDTFLEMLLIHSMMHVVKSR